jgi:hypothetical protein
MVLLRATCALPLAITGLLVACASTNRGPAVTGNPETGATESQKDTDLTVVVRLADARCDQEQGCMNIGADSKYASRGDCREHIHGSIANDLEAYDCPRGLDSDGIVRCIAAIKSEDCNHPFDTLARFDRCRTGAICMK